MIRNVFFAAIAAAALGAAPAFASAPFVEDDGNGGLRVVRPVPSQNIVGGAITELRNGSAGSLEVVTIQPLHMQEGRAVTVVPGNGAGELRIVPLAGGTRYGDAG